MSSCENVYPLDNRQHGFLIRSFRSRDANVVAQLSTIDGGEVVQAQD